MFVGEGIPEAFAEGRFLRPSERARLMGFIPERLEAVLSPREVVQARGNIMCVLVDGLLLLGHTEF